MKKLFNYIEKKYTDFKLCMFLLFVLAISALKHASDTNELRILRTDKFNLTIQNDVLEAICDSLKSERDNLLFWNNYSRKANQKEISDKIYRDRKNRVNKPEIIIE